jgi:hypothetical protein
MYRERAKILFELYTTIEKVNNLAIKLSYMLKTIDIKMLKD